MILWVSRVCAIPAKSGFARSFSIAASGVDDIGSGAFRRLETSKDQAIGREETIDESAQGGQI